MQSHRGRAGPGMTQPPGAAPSAGTGGEWHWRGVSGAVRGGESRRGWAGRGRAGLGGHKKRSGARVRALQRGQVRAGRELRCAARPWGGGLAWGGCRWDSCCWGGETTAPREGLRGSSLEPQQQVRRSCTLGGVPARRRDALRLWAEAWCRKTDGDLA